MTDDKIMEMGSLAETLLKNEAFVLFVNICETNLAMEMLASESAEDREKVHRKYLGLKDLVDMMKQLEAAKASLVSLSEEER